MTNVDLYIDDSSHLLKCDKNKLLLEENSRHWNDWRISKFFLLNPIYNLDMVQKFKDSTSTPPDGPDRRDVADSVIWRIESNTSNWLYWTINEHYSSGKDSKIMKFSGPRLCLGYMWFDPKIFVNCRITCASWIEIVITKTTPFAKHFDMDRLFEIL